MRARTTVGALATVVGLAVVVLGIASFGHAASVRTAAKVVIAPHVLSAGQDGFIAVTFVNRGPSTVNHALATVQQAVSFDAQGNVTQTAPLPLPTGAFPSASLPAGCSVVPGGDPIGSASTITCDIGQVKPGTVQRFIRFTAPSTVSPFFVFVSVTYDESKGTQNQDTVTDYDPYRFSLATGTDTKGQCTPAGATLSAGNAQQQTALTYPTSTAFPCTPAGAGVVGLGALPPITDVANPFNAISFVDFFGLGQVQVYFFSAPQGTNKNNLELFELPQFPISLEATGDGAPVPDCALVDGQPQIPDTPEGFVSCVVRVDNIPGGGLVVTLLVAGSGDPGWGGIG